jgi:hypothetical protein
MRKVMEFKWEEGAREICKREISLRERVRVGESESGREQGARPVGEWQLAVGGERRECVDLCAIMSGCLYDLCDQANTPSTASPKAFEVTETKNLMCISSSRSISIYSSSGRSEQMHLYMNS